MSSDLDEIRSFLALARAGSFVSAGRLINRDPAVVTRRLNQLEGRLGIRLVERTTRKVALTEAGQTYLARVGPILDDLESAEDDVAALAGGQARGNLRITLPGSFSRMWIAPMLVDFLKAHPAVTVEANTENRFVDLIAEGYDLAIRLGDLPDSRLVARRVASGAGCCAPAPAISTATRPSCRRGIWNGMPACATANECLPISGVFRRRMAVSGRSP